MRAPEASVEELRRSSPAVARILNQGNAEHRADVWHCFARFPAPMSTSCVGIIGGSATPQPGPELAARFRKLAALKREIIASPRLCAS